MVAASPADADAEVTDTRLDPDPAAEQASSETSRAPRPGRLRRVLLAVLALAVLLAGAALAWTLVRADGDDGVQSARDDVMAQAEQFVLRVNNFGPDDLDEQGKLPEYQALVEEVITPKLAESFAEGVPMNETRVVQLGETNTGDVYATGVSSLDDDSATVLVAGGVQVSYDPPPGTKRKGVPTSFQFRIQAELVKVDGEWLVDEYTPLAQES